MYFFRQLLDLVTAPLRALFSAPGRLLGGSRRALSISLPARVAILTALFLVICTAVSIAVFINTHDRAEVRAKITPLFVIVVSLLVIAIPIVLYRALRLWLEGDVSPFPDIERAWRAGLVELERQGLDLNRLPLFLVLGSVDENHEKALLEASQLNLNVKGYPAGPESLHWNVGPDGIYLFCSTVGCLSWLAHAAGKETEHAAPANLEAGRPPPRDVVRGTMLADRSPATEPAAEPASPLGRETMGFEAFGGDAMVADGRTMVGMGGGAHASLVARLASSRSIEIGPQQVSEEGRRLQYLCRLIRRARQPLVPINGLLTLLPLALIQRSLIQAKELQRAVRHDLNVLGRTLKVRCPVTALVHGFEQEEGFRELVRRVGRGPAVARRVGAGQPIDLPCTPQAVAAVAARACGNVEDCVYDLFRERGSLNKPGNRKLYALLCKIRQPLEPRLEDLLRNAYAPQEDASDAGRTMFFGGCYFAATGDSEDRQAFVKEVFKKLSDQQEELEWTEEAYREDRTYQTLAQLSLAGDTLLLLLLAGLIAYQIWK